MAIRGLMSQGNSRVEGFIGKGDDLAKSNDFASTIPPDGTVRIFSREIEMPPAKKLNIPCHMLFCVTYRSRETGIHRAAGAIMFTETIVGETDEEGWGNAQFYPHNFRVTYAD